MRHLQNLHGKHSTALHVFIFCVILKCKFHRSFSASCALLRGSSSLDPVCDFFITPARSLSVTAGITNERQENIPCITLLCLLQLTIIKHGRTDSLLDENVDGDPCFCGPNYLPLSSTENFFMSRSYWQITISKQLEGDFFEKFCNYIVIIA